MEFGKAVLKAKRAQSIWKNGVAVGGGNVRTRQEVIAVKLTH
jgi:hypothetical protein